MINVFIWKKKDKKNNKNLCCFLNTFKQNTGQKGCAFAYLYIFFPFITTAGLTPCTKTRIPPVKFVN